MIKWQKSFTSNYGFRDKLNKRNQWTERMDKLEQRIDKIEVRVDKIIEFKS